ncbi:MAG: hypothetical protein DA407_03505 [Bacteroidetes bacterium]|nr:MAG: hypothetical protein DA407_03505 [Bacteroidota bacterium]
MSSACSSSDDDDGSNNNNANPQEVINIAQSGNWTITYFFDTDSDESSDFNGYTFTFADTGVLTATNGPSTIIGTWSVTNSSSSSSNSDLDFNISFVSPPDFEELSDDWDIISYTSTKIELIDVSGGNGGTDYLTFEKQ